MCIFLKYICRFIESNMSIMSEPQKLQINTSKRSPIEAVGQKFDPNEHNAVMHMEDPEKGEGEIVQEFQKGFKMGDRVIRFSMVQVAN